MISMPDNPPDDLAALKQLLAQIQSKVVHLEEDNASLRPRLFGRKSEQIHGSHTILLSQERAFQRPTEVPQVLGSREEGVLRASLSLSFLLHLAQVPFNGASESVFQISLC